MNNTPNQPRWRPRFTLRTVLMLTLLVALLLGWRSSLRRAQMQLAQQAGALRYAEEELDRARDEIESRDRLKPDKRRIFWMAQLDGAFLRGVTISSPENIFQRASLQDCDLENATLKGGSSAFQGARFDRSKLMNAKLSGEGASFQGATFVDADLTDAVLTGSGSSFQTASFENATLVRARLAGSFQSVNLSGAHLEGADLSALNSDDLESCYFKEPPTYDSQTRFPTGFDPAAQHWRRVSEQE